MNLVVIDKCSNHCRYCFAATEMGRAESKNWLTREGIEEVIAFVQRSGPGLSVNVIGGEPFLYRDLGFLLDRLHAVPTFGSTTVFTGGIFRTSLLESISNHIHHTTLLVNLNQLRDYKNRAEYDLVLRNVARAQELGFSVVVGFNIWRVDFDGEEILDVCHSFGIERLRWTIAYPEAEPSNGVVTLRPDEYATVARRCATFLESAYQRGVQAWLDCPLPKCFFSLEELGRLALTHPGSVSAIRACGPVVDVAPDLTVFRCFALSGAYRRSLSEFSDLSSLIRWYERETDARYGPPQVFEACSTCEFAADRSCFGGCMAHSPSAIGARTPVSDLINRAHAAIEMRDAGTAKQALAGVSGRDAVTALMRAHIAHLEGDATEATRWARLTLGRARSAALRERAADLLLRLSEQSASPINPTLPIEVSRKVAR